MSDETNEPNAGAAPESAAASAFAALGLSGPVLKALADVGYETPSPIQAATIPPLLAGRDVLGQAQTGTGKTAAFALPILSKLKIQSGGSQRGKTQALVLAPTRELAIQVAEAFQRYAAHLPDFHVLPIYGGQSYGPQLAGLKRGVQVVVGTPGRVIDHIDRSSLDLSGLEWLVLDEADEMLRMGFIDDVEKILSKTPAQRQTALFSATMPPPIRRIAQTYLREPQEITIKSATSTATNIRQRYWYVSGLHKLDALTRILEAEPFDAMLIFARTKKSTEELAEKLEARGLAAAAINGDMPQQSRERAVERLKNGQLDILVATDVAARGLDVERISHVLNYDIPYDSESYVHRIGRTGRAGRTGDAILFVTPREKAMLRVIEKATRQPITEMQLPSVEAVNDRRIANFMQKITDVRAQGGLEAFQQIIENYERQHDVPALEIAAVLAKMAHGGKPLLLEPPPPRPPREFSDGPRESRGPYGERAPRDRAPRGDKPYGDRPPRPAREFGDRAPRGDKPFGDRPPRADKPFGDRPPRDGARTDAPRAPRVERFDGDAARPRPQRNRPPEAGMQRYRLAVGHAHGVKPGNIVGAIANEAGLDSKHIGRIEIHDHYSTIDLPEGMPRDTLSVLKKVRVAGQKLDIAEDAGGGGEPSPDRPFRPKRPRPG